MFGAHDISIYIVSVLLLMLIAVWSCTVYLPTPVPPPQPTNLQASSIGARTASLTWQKPVIRFQNSLTDVSSYQVTATQSQFSGLENLVTTVSTRSYTFPHTLEEYTLYSCTVKASNAFGLGNASHSVEFRTLQAG